jgi:hypothetical protein
MRRLAAVVIALVALSSPARGQGGNPIEIGLDGALSYGLDSPHITTVDIPVQRLRVGFFVAPTISIEPFGALNHTSVNGNSSTNLDIGAGALFHFTAARTAPQPYVRPFLEIVHSSFDGNASSASTTATALGAGVGVKFPLANRFAWRLEGALTHVLSHDELGSSTGLSALFGLSFFTR